VIRELRLRIPFRGWWRVVATAHGGRIPMPLQRFMLGLQAKRIARRLRTSLFRR
jgi:hypothetical protein